MPELGQYSFEVLTSYGVSLALIGVLVGVSVWQSRKVKAALQRIEKDG